MRWIKFLAGLGTIFVFIGIYCFKAAFNKQSFKEEMNLHTTPFNKYGKGVVIVLGAVCMLLGIALLIMGIRGIL